MKKTISFMLALLLVNVCFAQLNKDKLYQQVIGKYGKITSLFVVFDDEGGTLKNCKVKAKTGNKYIMNINSKQIISNGKTIWTYTPAKKMVVIQDYEDNEEFFSIDNMLLNTMENMQPTEVKSVLSAKDGKSNVLELQSKDTKSKMWIYCDIVKNKVTAIEIELSGERKKFYIKKLEINPKYKDSDFTFSIPKGVKVMDIR